MTLLLATSLLIQPAAIEDLRPGEHLVAVQPGQATKGEVVGVVDVSLDEVLAIVTDCEATPRWFPQIRETRVDGPGELGERCSGVTELPWPMADRTWTIEVGADEEAWVDLGTWIPDSLVALASKRILPGLIGGIEQEAARRDGQAAGWVASATDPRR